MRGRGEAAVLLTLIAVTRPGLAGPDEPARVVLEEGSCPSAEEVAALLGGMLTRFRPIVAPEAHGRFDLHVRDEGPRYGVDVGGLERWFEDETRDCTERSRNVAVFAALVLESASPLEPDVGPVQTAPARPSIAPARGSPAVLEVGGAAELGLGHVPFAPGGYARARYGRKPALSLGISGFVSRAAETDAYGAETSRFPIDMSLGIGARHRGFELTWDLGLFVAPLVIRGNGVANPQRQVRCEVGPRTAIAGRIGLSPAMALVVSTDLGFSPRPYVLDVSPDGQVGKTPTLWLGLSIGLAWTLTATSAEGFEPSHP